MDWVQNSEQCCRLSAIFERRNPTGIPLEENNLHEWPFSSSILNLCNVRWTFFSFLILKNVLVKDWWINYLSTFPHAVFKRKCCLLLSIATRNNLIKKITQPFATEFQISRKKQTSFYPLYVWFLRREIDISFVLYEKNILKILHTGLHN